jgi:hypothetical protein
VKANKQAYDTYFNSFVAVLHCPPSSFNCLECHEGKPPVIIPKQHETKLHKALVSESESESEQA